MFLSRIGFSTFVIIGVLLFVGAIAGGFIIQKSTEKTVTFRVKDKERVQNCNSDGCDSKYLIFTDHGTFKDTDALLYFKFNSSDLYGNLERGKTYTCKVNGFRFGFTSSYQNIISCEDAS
jgi:hypothetical protein